MTVMLCFLPDVMAKRMETARDTVTDVRAAFLALPASSDLLILPPAKRQDMLDYLSVDSLAPVRNAFQGESRITEYTPGYLALRLTGVSTLQIKELTGGNGEKIFMTIYTVSSENVAGDSTVKFYDMFMTPLDAEKIMKTPDPSLFWVNADGKTPDKRTLEEMMQEVPFYTVEYSASPSDDRLIGKLTMEKFLTVETTEKVKPYLRHSLIWRWNGKRYELQPVAGGR